MGSLGEGFTIKVFPVARANGENQRGTINGKLKGARWPKTPKG
jgi:hypothetical protein